jgi:hypothetical protein
LPAIAVALTHLDRFHILVSATTIADSFGTYIYSTVAPSPFYSFSFPSTSQRLQEVISILRVTFGIKMMRAKLVIVGGFRRVKWLSVGQRSTLNQTTAYQPIKLL